MFGKFSYQSLLVLFSVAALLAGFATQASAMFKVPDQGAPAPGGQAPAGGAGQAPAPAAAPAAGQPQPVAPAPTQPAAPAPAKAQSASASSAEPAMIEIDSAADPEEFWDAFFQSHREDPARVRRAGRDLGRRCGGKRQQDGVASA